jgi:heme-degrading monooxygenase HmoA
MEKVMTPEERTAGEPTTSVDGPVTLINSFQVPAERDEAFHELWTETSMYFRQQPGFVSLRLHRAVNPDATYRWVNVATWDSEAHYRAGHLTDEFRRLVTQDAWREFPSNPSIYEVVTAVGAGS